MYFDYGKYELTPQAKQTLDYLVVRAKLKEIIQIEIHGHTDSDGNSSYNKKLSQNRTRTIQQYLTSKGISNDKFKIQFFGEDQPIATNDNNDGKQRNRRVEIIIECKIETVDHEYIQTFKVSTQQEIIIEGKKGTLIKIPANSLVDANGVISTDEITIELTEIYTKSDMILNNAQTISNQTLLETSGMVYIRAISQSGKVSLKKDGFYTIEFPTKRKQKDMNIFYRDSISRNMNWQLANRNFQSDYTYIEDQKALDKYIFNSTKFGWINCDRFINQTETTDLIVNTPDTLGVNFCLVFKSINAVMNVSDRNGVIKFHNVPVGQTAILIAFKRTSQETFYSRKTLVLQKNQSIQSAEIAVKRLTDDEFRHRIKDLDK